MSFKWLLPVLLVLAGLSVRGLEAVSVVAQRPDDDYILEHEVSKEKALANARNLKLYSGPIPGCKPCTSQEMTYCQNGSILQDHCCCDAGYNEVLEFVEHKCHVGPEACHVQAGDCAEYSRLRECCCYSYLKSLWKYLAAGAAPTRASYFLLGLSILFVLIDTIR